MEILISIAAKIAEYTVAPIGRQASYLIFYRDNLKELMQSVEKLEGVRERIKRSVEEDRRNGREIFADVQRWLERVDKIIKEAKKLHEDSCRANVGCSKWYFPDLRSRHQLSRNAKKMARTVVEEQGKGNFDRVGFLPHLGGLGLTLATRGSENLKSRKAKKEDVVLALRDSKVSKIGVYGLGGVGKTTLVKEVAKQVKDDMLFDEVVIANVSQTPNLKRIQNEIAGWLGLRFEETFGRERRLCERIKKEKTILIILDDIWVKIDLEKLGIPSHNDHKGCKLLLISRNQDILQKMESEKDIRLECLNEEETWSLFEAIAGEVVKNPNLQSIAAKVAEKCAGLPILVVTVAGALKSKDIYYWKDALNQLERIGNGEISEIAYSTLELSYNWLGGDEVKTLFLLCGVLGTSSSVRDLLHYGFGLGIFKHRYTLEDARNRLYKMISDLRACCLLLEDDTSATVRMHDIVQEVAIQIASRDKFVFVMKRNAKLEDWPTKNFLRRCTQIILHSCCIQKLPERLDCPKLKVFLLNSIDNRSLEIPPSFFEGTRNLEVLVLTGMIMSCLPTSLACLTKLKTFCLDQCALRNMVGMGVLENLEIVSCAYSSIEEFPSEIGQMTHLRRLDLKDSRIEVMPSNVISKLTKLEELCLSNTSIKWEEENSTKQSKNASLAELRHLTNLTALEIQIHEASILPRDLMFEKLERYKIIIGDKWKWFDEYGASRLLKLKLGTSIRLEHGIKALIKRVEVLYLDGISNVLYELNEEGFPWLEHLHIQNNARIQHIVNSKGRNQTHAFFPNLETIILHNLTNLEKICHGPGPLTVNSFSKLKLIKVKSCNQLEYLFLVSIIKDLSQLFEIEVTDCNSIKTIVFVESMNSDTTIHKIELFPLRSLTLQNLLTINRFCSDELTSSTNELNYKSLRTNIPTLFFNAEVAFPNLETLKLRSINLNKVWDDDQLSVVSSLQNLANLVVEDCGSLKYLFSSFMVCRLKNLKQLEISKCHMMEEIIATEDRNNGAAINEVRFSNLEGIKINDMENLKTAWHYQFEGLKTLEVSNCEKLRNIFPSYCMQETFRSIETLEVKNCALVEEIFELTANGVHGEEDITQLKNLTLVELPKMKRIWSRDPQGFLRFCNLQYVEIYDCQNLKYLFPFSIAKDLQQLENLSLQFCGMKEIVAKNDEPLEETAILELNHLRSLTLRYLDKLEGFYGGVHTLACRSLKRLDVCDCKKLPLFNIRSNRCQESSTDDQRHFSKLQPLFIVEEVIGNFEELSLDHVAANMILQQQFSGDLFCKLKRLKLSNCEDDQATFSHRFPQNISNLEELNLSQCSFKEIFYDEIPTGREGGRSTRLKRLTLMFLPKLQHICKEGCRILEVLDNLFVGDCSSLRNLVPSSVTFCHLTHLTVTDCGGLINLISSSTARSLVKLRTMRLSTCKLLEEIVTEEVDETKSEITFSSLAILELELLPRLNSFSSSKCFLKFPLLEKVIVTKCPTMKIFSAGQTSIPMLKKVLITRGKNEEWRWEGDLNGTINKMFLDKDAFRSFEHLELSEYPELKELWYDQFEHKIFCNLKSLVVEKCDFLSTVLLPSNLLRALSNLEMLEVRDCGSLEAVFDLNGMNEREMLVEEIIPLKEIELSDLPKIKNIWKQDSQEIMSFDNSRDDHAIECHELKISEASGIHKISEENKVDIECQQHLFLPKKVLFPKLETMRVSDMKNLKTIWHPTLTQNSFGGFKTLEVRKCEKLGNIFPSHMLRICATLETLEVSDCNLVEVIFEVSANETHCEEDMTHLKNLTLRWLPKLKHIWSRDPQGILRFHNLQVMTVKFCSNLEYLLPFSIATNLLYLEKIEVNKCGIKEIVANKEGAMDGTATFAFNHLISLVLRNLHKLERFYARNYTLVCQSLKAMKVLDCNLELFKTQSMSPLERGASNEEKSIAMPQSMQQPLFMVKEVIPNLEELALNKKAATMMLQGQYSGELFTKLKLLRVSQLMYEPITFPYWFLKNVPSLESLTVKWSSFEEVFQDETLVCKEEGKDKISTGLKVLALKWLPKLQHICKEGCRIEPVLEVLEDLRVIHCSSLVRMVPYSVTFGHLTHLEVRNCNGLIDLIASSTARSLVKLRTMKIKECNSLEQIVTEEGDVTKDEIAFGSLEVLELACLPSLNRFCSSNCLLKFPLLEKVVVKQCPRMEIFSVRETSTPNLQNVQVEEGEEKWFWEGDLNRTIYKMFLDKVAFGSIWHLNLSEYPELKDLWFGQVWNKKFCNLKSLTVHKCDFLSNVLLSSNLLCVLPNLEMLEVSDCGSLEAVFDLNDLNERETRVEETIPLEEITLSNLPKLKHIWKQDSQEIVSFDHSGECHQLKISEAAGIEKIREEDKVDIQRQQSLFLAKKVLLPKLETMRVSDMENLKTIWHPTLTPNSFGGFKTLEVENCEKLGNIFPSHMLGICASLETLEVRNCSSVEVIFQLSANEMHSEEDMMHLEKVIDCDSTSVSGCGVEEIVAIEEGSEEVRFNFPRLTILRLRSLTKLKSFYPGRHILECPSLEILDVSLCEALQIFAFDHIDFQQTHRVDEVDMPIQQVLFYVEKVAPNLEELTLNVKDAMRILNGHYEAYLFHSVELLRLECFQETPIIFLNDILKNFPKTTTLQVRYSSFGTLFPSEGIGHCSTESPTQIKELWLYKLEQLKHIWNDNSVSDLLVQDLEDLSVVECSGLIKLAPPSISFINLTTLAVRDCKGLIYLMTSSTAKSLVHLTSLTVENCEMIEVVVMIDEGESEEEITFESLEDLHLNSLSSFKSFCSGKHTFMFPSLETLRLTECPKMRNFSSGVIIAPFLIEVEVENGEKQLIKEGLNTTIEQMFMDKDKEVPNFKQQL